MQKSLTSSVQLGPVPADLDDLRRISALCGQDITMTQGAGGNTSIKHNGVLWIKASGTWLSKADRDDIFVPVDIAAELRRLDAGDADCMDSAILGKNEPRASIEGPVHAALPQRVVIHLHCVNTIAYAVRADGQAKTAPKLEGLSWIWVPYRRPGAPLARIILDLVTSGGGRPDVFILENHGLVVCGDTVDAATECLKVVRRRLSVEPTAASMVRPAPRQSAPAAYRWTDDETIARLAFDAQARVIAAHGVLYPDHMVFLGPAFPEVRLNEDIGSALARWRAAFGAPPIYLVVPEVGVLVAESAVPNTIAMLQCLGLVTARLGSGNTGVEKLRYLSAADNAELVNWDAEFYRQKLAMIHGRAPGI